MKVQPLLSTKVDGLFDLSLCTDDVIFEIINLTAEEIGNCWQTSVISFSSWGRLRADGA